MPLSSPAGKRDRAERQLHLPIVLPHERMLPGLPIEIALETQLALSTALQPAASTTSFVNTSFLAAARRHSLTRR